MLLRIALVQMVYVHCAGAVDQRGSLLGDEIHEVEEVTALLDERTAGISREAVPVAHLLQERKAVLANLSIPDPPNRAGANLLQRARHRSHEAILHPDPNEAGMLGGRLHHPKAMLDLRAQR